MPIVPPVGEVKEKKPGMSAPRGGLVTSAVENQRQSDDLRARLLRTAKEKPDEFAQALKLSGVTGLPVDLVKRNMPEVQAQADAEGFPIESLRSTAPDLYGWLTEKDENMVLAKDDLGNLSGVPWALKAIPQAFKYGQQQTELAKLRYKQMTLGLTPEEMNRVQSLSGEVNRPRRYAADGFFSRSAVETAKMLPGTLSSLAGGLEGGAQGAIAGGTMAAIAGQLGPQVATPEEIVTVPGASIAGFTAGSAGGAAMASLEMEAGLAFDEFAGFKDAAGVPLDQGTAAAAAMTAGMINAGFEVTGLGAVVKAFPGVDKLFQKGASAAVKAALKNPTVLEAFKNAGLKFGKGWSMETGTEVAQELVTIVAGELAKQAGGGDFEAATGAQIGKRLADTLESAALGSWMLPASGAGAGFVMDAKRAAKAQTNVERFKALGESAKASKLLERAPAKFREYVEAVKKAAGPDGIQNVYVDAAQATQLFQAAGLDPQAFFEEVIGADGARDYNEALALGGRVAIPVEAYAEKIAGSDLHAQLMEHAAIDEEAMTPFEAKQFEASRDAELAKIYGEGRPADDPTNPIFDDTVGQLIGAGFSQKDAEDQARLRVGVYSGLAARAGLTPDEFLTRFPLTIERPLDKVLTYRNQVGPLDPLIDAIRSGKLPTDEELFGPRLLSAIVGLGGINLESVGGGDLAKVLDQVKRPGLVSEKGKTVEDMAEHLAASGWRELFRDLDDYGRPGPDELVELIRADLIEPVRNPNTRNEERLAFRRAAESLGDELHRLGVDVQSLTNAQISERLRVEDEKARANTGEQLEQGPGSANFDAWFAGSKVVDENGEPLVVYHGTSASDDFSTFETGDRGAWFGADPAVASMYATGNDTQKAADAQGAGETPLPRVLPVYLSIKNPYVVTEQDWKAMRGDTASYQQKQRELTARVKAAGHDGISYGDGVWTAFEPEQIKSAVGNSGAFDPNDPNMLNQAAYHGTPHTIGPEGFSLSKIGTGEGAQAYGWGLYFAENPAIAGGYYQRLSPTPEIAEIQLGSMRLNDRNHFDYTRRASESDIENVRAALAEDVMMDSGAVHGAGEEGFQAFVLKTLDDRIKGNYDPELEAKLIRAAQTLRKMLERPGAVKVKFAGDRTGGVYQVDIPDEATARFLSWDKPMSEQPEAVRKALGVPVRDMAAEEALLARAQEMGVPASSLPEYAELEKQMDEAGPHTRETGEDYYQSLVAAARNERAEKSGPTYDAVKDAPGYTDMRPDEIASRYLISRGVPGIRYLDGSSRDKGDGDHNLVVFDDSLIEITHKDGSPVSKKERREFLEQRKPRDKQPRGAITGAMPKDRKGNTRPFKISLFKRADLTTFTHEVGHMAFAMLADLADDFATIDPASRTASQQQIVDDYQAMLDWVGAPDFKSMTVPQLEKTARGLEAYVMEGKAPSPELRSVFARLRSFMVAVYRTIKGLNVELTDPVRQVFDRLLASDDQIRQAREKEKYEALWNAPDDLLAVGATGQEVAAYMAATQAATDRAVDKLTAKVMAPIRKRREESFADLRATVEKEVAEELDDLPVYRAIAALTGQNVPEDLVGKVRKLDREWLLDRYGQEWMNKNLLRRRVYAAEGGMSADLAASLLGYGSGRELVEAIAQAPSRREYLKAETERRLNEIIPDPIRDGSISDEAVAALHNERRGDTLALELKILNRAAGNGSVELPKQVARRIAERVVGDRRVRDINPNRYRLDERTASRKATEALIAKDYEAAAAAKRQELLAFYLWKVSSEAREEADKARDYLDSQAKTSARERLAKAGAEYVKAADDITSTYGFRPRGDVPSTLRDFVTRQDELGNETAVADEVIARTERPQPVSWRDVSMNELRGARDAARNVAHLAKLSREALANDQVVEWTDARTQLVDAIRNSTKAGKSHTKIVTQGAMGRLGDASRELMAEWLRPETIIEWLDGGESGPWHDLFWNQANTSEDRRGVMRERVLKPLVDLVEKGGAKFREHMADKIPIKTLGVTFTRGELVSMALNMGNASNLDKLSRGGMLQDGQHVEFGPAVLEEVKSALTAEDWKLVQFMWDQVDSMWPEVVEFQKAMGGLVPEKVEAMAVDTPHGTFRGGYWPVVYDPKQSATGAKQEAAKALSDVMGGITRATTKKSHLKARTEVARPLLLDFQRILVRHVDEVITDLTHRRFVLQANKIMADAEITNLIRERLGSQAFDSLRGMVANTIGDRKYHDPALETGNKFFDGLVRNTAVAALGLKVATAIGNLTVAPIQAAARVNPVHLVRGIGMFMASPRKTRDAVWAMSPFMKQRAENFDSTFADVLKSLRGEHTIRAQIARASMAVHRWADFMGSTGIWMGRYLQAIAEKETPDQAVRLADKAIRQTQTAGAPKDLSAFERSPQHKLARLFLGPMLIMQNRIRDAVGLRGKVKNMPEAIGTLFAVWFLPAIMFELAVGRGPDDGDDDELDAAEAAQWAAIKVGMYPMMTVPYLRDASSMIEGVVGGDNMPARLNPLGEAVKLLTQAAKKSAKAFDSDDVDAAELVKAWAKAAGPIVGLPTGPITLAGDFVWDVLTGEYDPEGVSDARYLFYRRDED